MLDKLVPAKKMKSMSDLDKEEEAQMAKLYKEKTEKGVVGVVNWLRMKIKGDGVKRAEVVMRFGLRIVRRTEHRVIVRCVWRERKKIDLSGLNTYYLVMLRDILTELSPSKRHANHTILLKFSK